MLKIINFNFKNNPEFSNLPSFSFQDIYDASAKLFVKGLFFFFLFFSLKVIEFSKS